MPDSIYDFSDDQINTIRNLIGRVENSSRYLRHRQGGPATIGRNLRYGLYTPIAPTGDIAQQGAYTPVYQYIYEQLIQVPNPSQDLKDMILWFDQATYINMNAGPAAEWIRTYTERGIINAGIESSVSEAEMDAISNSIGAFVTKDILETGELRSLSDILSADIQNALDGTDQFGNVGALPRVANIGGWGGAFYFWDAPFLDAGNGADWTIGDEILSNSASKELFIDTAGDALAQMARLGNLDVFLSTLLPGENAIEQSLSRLNSLPLDVRRAIWQDAAAQDPLAQTFMLLMVDENWKVGFGNFPWFDDFDPTDYESTTIERLRQLQTLENSIGASLDAPIQQSLPNDSIIQDIGIQFGQSLADPSRDGTEVIEDAIRDAINGDTLGGGDALAQVAQIGSISSALSLELGNALGLDGFGAELLNNVGATVIDQVSSNAIQIAQGNLSSSQLFNGLNVEGVLRAGVAEVGAYFGSRLANEIVSPQTQAAVHLGRYLSISGRLLGEYLCGPVCGAIGSFIGKIVGTFIGNLFGKKKPKIPTAQASTILNVGNGDAELGSVSSTNSGNEDFVSAMANAAADTVNGIADILKGGSSLARNLTTASMAQTYGHTGNQLYVNLGGTQHNVTSAEAAITKGAIWAADQLKIAGGDMLAQRALSNNSHDDLARLFGDFAIAHDYTHYLNNKELINDLIIDVPNSAAAASWIIVLQRAAELGLNKSAASDFYGGMKGFADSLQGIINQPFNYEDLVLYVRGDDLEVYYDADGNGSAHSSYDDLLFDETGFLRSASHADGGVGYHRAYSNAEMTGGNDIITNASGTIDDQTTTTVTTEDRWIYNARLGEWVFIPGTTTTTTTEGGDDIIIGNSATNTFYGRSGDDWLDGGSGAVRDNLHGGDGNDVLIGRGGDDYLYGNNDDDVLIGGSGYDRMYGGNGNDTFYGDGNNWRQGDAGDDTYILSGGAGWHGWAYDGNGNTTTNLGNDTLSFENIGWGVKIDMGRAKPASWLTSTWWVLPHADTRYIYAESMDGANGVISLGTHKVENLTGTAFADDLTGDARNNILRGGAGDDTIRTGGGTDWVEGGAGADTILRTNGGYLHISYEHSQGGVDVSISHSDAHAFGGDASGDTFSNVHGLKGSNFADVLEGNTWSNTMYGLDGDDYFIATRGYDNYYGGDGFDTVDFGNHQGTSGLTINGTNGVATHGYNDGATYGYSRMYDVEHIVGTSRNDTIRFGAGDNVLEGGKGVDTLYGGAGNDIYFVEFGGGNDQIYEYGNQGHDTIMVGYEDGLSWDDVTIGAGANLTIHVSGQGTLATAYNSPNDNRELVGIDAIDIGGVGGVDIWFVNYGWSSRTAYGSGYIYRGDHPNGTPRRNLIQASHGNDIIYAAGTSSDYETENNFLHGKRGNDTIYASVGDDQYIFDRGSGRDAIYDSGGLDHIQFGPGVSASDVIFEVIGSNLYIGIAPEGTEDTSTLRASQMADRMTIVGGGSATQQFGGALTYSGNLLEYITVENINMDI